MYVSTNIDGRILVTTEHKEYTNDTYFEFEFPKDFDFSKQYLYVIQNGELLLNPPPKSEEEIEAEKEVKRRSQMKTAVLLFVQSSNLPDEQALKVSELYEEWNNEAHYDKDYICRYKDELYRCIQAHDAQESWTPEAASSLWAKILPGQQGEIGEWVQPDSTNPYNKGDKVTHNGKTWVSDIDNNIWEPGVYGWTEDSGTIPEPEPEPGPTEPAEWKQPTGGHDAYKIGDRVKFKGSIYESTINNNTWSPEAYPAGWKKVQ